MPRFVSRTIGGSANTIVTIVADTSPMPKKKMNGSMNTNEWTTCMASSVGRTTFQTASTRPETTPTGMPTIAHKVTDTRIMPIVRDVSVQ